MPTYNEDLLSALNSLQSLVNRAIKETDDLDRNLDKYTSASLASLKASVKTLAWPDTLSAQLLEWDGVATPE
jgi:hypothetical protein